ncbi:hypothetical protein RJ641_015654 [Dillenia turbinata]|uniref:BHLH domain-containing protein n=1 Tax=Dillenia turbinata TaxID=194707 RepID=A0AAN8UPZ5_9MAGN
MELENTQHQRTTTTLLLQRTMRKNKKVANKMCENGGQKSSKCRSRGSKMNGRVRTKRRTDQEKNVSDDEDKVEVEKKIMQLQGIIPNGESLGIDTLFEETARYILALQAQVKAMKVVAAFFEGLEKETRKFGG